MSITTLSADILDRLEHNPGESKENKRQLIQNLINAELSRWVLENHTLRRIIVRCNLAASPSSTLEVDAPVEILGYAPENILAALEIGAARAQLASDHTAIRSMTTVFNATVDGADSDLKQVTLGLPFRPSGVRMGDRAVVSLTIHATREDTNDAKFAFTKPTAIPPLANAPAEDKNAPAAKGDAEEPYICGACKQPMRYNVPRMGPAGGFVHVATGKTACE